MRTQVDGERRVPILRRCSGEPTAAADTDVQHQSVERARDGRRFDERAAVVLRRDVTDEHVGVTAFAGDPLRRLLAGLLVAIGTQNRCSLARRQHRDGAAVADGRVLVIRWLCARSDHEHALALEPRPAHPSNPGTPSSRCTPSEFSVYDTRWYCPTTIGTSMSWGTS